MGQTERRDRKFVQTMSSVAPDPPVRDPGPSGPYLSWVADFILGNLIETTTNDHRAIGLVERVIQAVKRRLFCVKLHNTINNSTFSTSLQYIVNFGNRNYLLYSSETARYMSSSLGLKKLNKQMFRQRKLPN